MTDEIVTNSAGGKQSKVEGRFDLLPPHALDRIAKILETGANKYGEWNWRNISSKDHLNHAINHLFKYIQDDQSEDHLGNAGCRILFLLDMIFIEEREAKSQFQDIGETLQEEDTFPIDKNTGLIYCKYLQDGTHGIPCMFQEGHKGAHSFNYPGR
jgi:hypothetical protein